MPPMRPAEGRGVASAGAESEREGAQEVALGVQQASPGSCVTVAPWPGDSAGTLCRAYNPAIRCCASRKRAEASPTVA